MTRREKVGAWLDAHPLTWHAIVGAPISGVITAYMEAGGAGWLDPARYVGVASAT